jgi:hypothetical protein
MRKGDGGFWILMLLNPLALWVYLSLWAIFAA